MVSIFQIYQVNALNLTYLEAILEVESHMADMLYIRWSTEHNFFLLFLATAPQIHGFALSLGQRAASCGCWVSFLSFASTVLIF
jgi:hypothetical protein